MNMSDFSLLVHLSIHRRRALLFNLTVIALNGVVTSCMSYVYSPIFCIALSILAGLSFLTVLIAQSGNVRNFFHEMDAGLVAMLNNLVTCIFENADNGDGGENRNGV
jgi:hypothetical protein